MYGLSDDFRYLNAMLSGTEKSVKILLKAVKTVSVNGDPLMKAVVNEALVKYYENEKKTKEKAEKE